MTFLESFAAEKEAEFLSHVRPEILDLCKRGNITYEEYRELQANSYERKLLVRQLTDDALIRHIREVMLPNCQYRQLHELQIARHYDEAVIGELFPMVLDRMESLLKKQDGEASGDK